jgi:peptide/nickel transport system substrate-binding protein
VNLVNLSRFRRGQGEIANHVIDEYAAGRLSRRDFIRRGTVVGISIPVIDAILTACGSSPSSTGSASTSASASSSGSATAAGRAGATINAGIVVPTAEINPLTVADQGGLDMLAQTGEYCACPTSRSTCTRCSPPRGRPTPPPTCGRSRSARA